MQNERFEVYCQAERMAIGELLLPKGRVADTRAILQGFTPVSIEYALKALPGQPEKLLDGSQALCPRCANPILIREPNGNSGIFLVPGAFEVAK